ncbi:MAG: calcium/sodium antiporter [Candidatus Pacebacteria bacterium]|nr:calcium/sodium antiporter [Candidatus Paceibacterota bacterium]
MVLTIILFVLGFALLIKGADFLVEGSSSIAKKFGLSSIMIGLTIVAFGTSLPELIVSVLASLEGSSDIAISNIIGSNFSNTLLILGATALVSPLLVKKHTIYKEIPFALLAVVAVFILVNDFLIEGSIINGLSRIDGLVLILFFLIFLYYSFGLRKEKEVKLPNLRLSNKDADIKEYNHLRSITYIILGVIALYFGGRWIVSGAVEIAGIFNLSEAFVGLTIIAIGTSLPELVTSVVAARKGEADMAVGNIIGSNVFNLFWILGLSATIHPIYYNDSLNLDLFILAAVTIILIPLIYAGKKNILTRREGFVLLSLYIIYIIFISLRG